MTFLNYLGIMFLGYYKKYINLAKAEEYFKSIDCKRINIEVFDPNKKGLNFYEKNDYIIVSKRI